MNKDLITELIYEAMETPAEDQREPCVTADAPSLHEPKRLRGEDNHYTN